MKNRSIIVVLAALMVSASAFAQDWAQFGRYSEANSQVSRPPKAVFMGDSITDAWADMDGGFFTSNNYLGRGISGQTTSQMLVRFRRDVLDLCPEYVVILAGTNDIAKNNGDIALENILGNIVSMCELAVVNGVKPVICSVLPAAAYSWRPELKPAGDIIRLNAMLREYAQKNGIAYVDYHSVLKDEKDGLPQKHASDGVHPNIGCYRIMEDVVRKYL